LKRCERRNPRDRLKFFSSSKDAAQFLQTECGAGDLLLVKGSRGVKMERIVEALLEQHGAQERQRRSATRCCTTSSINAAKIFQPTDVFRYITVRTVYASLTAMFLALVFGPWLIRRLRELQIGQYIAKKARRNTRKKLVRQRWAAC